MKKASILALVLVLTATLFTGCRNMGSTSTTKAPAASSSTRPTVAPKPTLPLPSGSTTNPGGTTTPGGATTTPGGVTEPGTSGAARRPSARGPRY